MAKAPLIGPVIFLLKIGDLFTLCAQWKPPPTGRGDADAALS